MCIFGFRVRESTAEMYVCVNACMRMCMCMCVFGFRARVSTSEMYELHVCVCVQYVLHVCVCVQY